MSTVLTQDRRIWPPILVTAGLLVGAVVAVLNLPGPAPTTEGSPSVVEGIPQAEWKIRTYTAVKPRKLKQSEKARVSNQGAAVGSLIQEVYDAAFLDLVPLQEVARASFDDRAARALIGSDIGLPDGATDIRTLRRRADIGVAAPSATRAAATVTVLARATLDDRDIRVRHHSVLWLERAKGGWRVIGFEIDQRPVR